MESTISRKFLIKLSYRKQFRKFHDFDFLLNINIKDLVQISSQLLVVNFADLFWRELHTKHQTDQREVCSACQFSLFGRKMQSWIFSRETDLKKL